MSSDDDPTVKLPSDDFAERLRELTSPVYDLEKRMQQIEQQVAATHKLEEQVAALDLKVDKRLHDTRPIWEGVLAEVKNMKTEMEDQVVILREDVYNLRAKYLDFERRIQELESLTQKSK